MAESLGKWTRHSYEERRDRTSLTAATPRRSDTSGDVRERAGEARTQDRCPNHHDHGDDTTDKTVFQGCNATAVSQKIM
jgi:hypothetical protein